MFAKAYFKNLYYLVGGTAISQLIVVLISPIFTRLYSPNEFGLLGVFVAIMSIVSVFSTMQYQALIPVLESSEEVINTIALCILILIPCTFLSLIFLIFFGDYFLAIMNVEEIGVHMYLIPVSVALLGIFQILRLWIIRVQDFKLLGRFMIIRVLAMSAIQLIGYKLGFTALVVGQIVGRTSGLATMIRTFINGNNQLIDKISLRKIKQLARRHSRFPIFVIWGNLFSQFGLQLPVLFLASLFSPISAGYYVLAQRVLAVPLDTLSVSVAELFLANVKESATQGTLSRDVTLTVNILSFLAMPVVLGLTIVAPELFKLVFGHEWLVAGEFVQLLSPMFFVRFVTFPLTGVSLLLEREREGFIFQIALVLGRVVAVYIGYSMSDVVVAVFCYSLISTLCYLLFLFYLLTISKANTVNIGLRNLKSVGLSFLITSPLFLYTYSDGILENIVGAILLTALLYLVRLYYIYQYALASR